MKRNELDTVNEQNVFNYTRMQMTKPMHSRATMPLELNLSHWAI